MSQISTPSDHDRESEIKRKQQASSGRLRCVNVLTEALEDHTLARPRTDIRQDESRLTATRISGPENNELHGNRENGKLAANLHKKALRQ